MALSRNNWQTHHFEIFSLLLAICLFYNWHRLVSSWVVFRCFWWRYLNDRKSQSPLIHICWRHDSNCCPLDNEVATLTRQHRGIDSAKCKQLSAIEGQFCLFLFGYVWLDLKLRWILVWQFSQIWIWKNIARTTENSFWPANFGSCLKLSWVLDLFQNSTENMPKNSEYSSFLCVKMLLKCKYFTVDQSKTSEEGGGCQEWTQLTRLPPFTSTKAR